MNKTAYEYLKKQAIEAHLAGDAYKVIHICNVGIENFISLDGEKLNDVVGAAKSNPKKCFKVKRDLYFNDWHWFFSLYAYWNTESFGYFSFIEKLKVISATSKDKKLINAYKKFLTCLFSLIEHSFELKEEYIDNEINFSECIDFLKNGQLEDNILICYVIEVIFVKAEDKRLWVKYYNILWNIANRKLKKSLEALHKRLSWQSRIFFSTTVDGFDYSDDIENFSIEQGVLFYHDCDANSLLDYIKKAKGGISLDNPEYIPFAQLLRSLALTWGRDDETLAEFKKSYVWNIEYAKYMLAGNSIKSNIFIDNLSNSLEKDSSGYKAWLLMIHSLRNWLIYSFTSSCKYLRLYFENENGHENKVLYYGLKAHNIDLNRDKKIREAVYRFDLLDNETRRKFFGEILTFSNNYLYGAHELLTILSDSIPYDLLPNFAEWTLRFENNEVNTTGQKTTWLKFWHDIFLYADPNNEFFTYALNQLSASIFKLIDYKYFSHTEWKLLISYGKVIGYNECLKLLKKLRNVNNEIDQNAKSCCWTIIFNICRERPDFLEENLDWLNTNSVIQPECEVWTSDLISSKIGPQAVGRGIKNGVKKLKDSIIAPITQKLNTVIGNDEKKSHVEMENIKHIELVYWGDDTVCFVKKLIEAYENNNVETQNKWYILVYLKKIYSNASQTVMNEIFDNIDKLLYQDEAYVNFNLGQEKYRLLSVQIPLCYAFLKQISPDTKFENKLGIIKIFISDIGNMDDLCFLDVLFSLDIFFALNSSNPIEKLLFLSKAESLLCKTGNNVVKEIQTSKYRERLFYENQMAGIIYIIADYISTDSVSYFKEMLRNEEGTFRNKLENIFKGILISYSKHPSYTLRAAVGYVLAKWKINEDLNFGNDLAECLTKLKHDSRMRVKYACTGKRI